MDERPRSMISVAAELVDMHPQTLRIFAQKSKAEGEAVEALKKASRENPRERLFA